jgi:hypothetical protein
MKPKWSFEMSNQFRVVISRDVGMLTAVMADEMDGEAIKGDASFVADSLEAAEQIIAEHTATPGVGGVIIAPANFEHAGFPLVTLPQRTREAMRTREAIYEAEAELSEKIWYDRHQQRMNRIETGEWKPSTGEQPYVFGAKKSARDTEEKYGKENLGPYTDLEWGMMNGKLSALRWVLGEQWDERP